MRKHRTPRVVEGSCNLAAWDAFHWLPCNRRVEILLLVLHLQCTGATAGLKLALWNGVVFLLQTFFTSTCPERVCHHDFMLQLHSLWKKKATYCCNVTLKWKFVCSSKIILASMQHRANVKHTVLAPRKEIVREISYPWKCEILPTLGTCRKRRMPEMESVIKCGRVMNSLTSKTLQWTSSDTAACVQCAFFVCFFTSLFFFTHAPRQHCCTWCPSQLPTN